MPTQSLVPYTCDQPRNYYGKYSFILFISPLTLPMQLADEFKRRRKKEPFVVVLDSLGGRQDAVAADILEYLTVEWNTNNIIDKSEANFTFDRSGMKLITPKCPGQSDESSCGLYLIQYLRNILQDIEKFSYSQSYKNIENWIEDDEMYTKRSEIGSLLKGISKKQGRYKNLSWPDINYFPKNRISESNLGRDDFDLFSSYAKRVAEKQANFSLCRRYKVPVAVSGDRYRHLECMLGNFKKDKECISIREFRVFINTRSEQPFTHSETMLCLEKMETNGLVMIAEDTVYILGNK